MSSKKKKKSSVPVEERKEAAKGKESFAGATGPAEQTAGTLSLNQDSSFDPMPAVVS